MKAQFATAVVVVAALSMSVTAQAQGIVGGGTYGAAVGKQAAGPVGAVAGAVVGGAVGGVVGGVKGVLGIPDHNARAYYDGRRRHR